MKKIKAYHGSNSVFRQFDQNKSRIYNDFYGGGIAYFTDELSVAKTYAKNMSKKSGEPIIYEVELSFKKLFDINDEFTGKELIRILSKDKLEDFARGAGLLKLGSGNQFTILAKLRKGEIVLSGDQVFKGLSRGMNQTAKARQILIDLGYDGLRYNGGVNMGMATKHNVYLSYDARNIKMTRVFKIVRKNIKESYGLGGRGYGYGRTGFGASGRGSYGDSEESIRLTELPRELQAAYRAVKTEMSKIGSKFVIKFNKNSNKIHVDWGDSYRKDSKLVKKERAVFNEFAYGTKYRQFKGMIIFSDESSGNIIKEDAPITNVGSGHIAGAPPDQPGVNNKTRLVNTTLIRRRRQGNDEYGESMEYDTTFAGHACFDVSDECFHRARLGKKNNEHYKTYVGEDETGQKIREYGRNNPGKPIVVRNPRTGAMVFLRYGAKK